VSNEQAVQTDVYFDDVKMTYTPTNILQSNEYYPFGLLTQNSWTRDNAAGNNFLYNDGAELNNTTSTYETFFRGYDPALGRFMQVDPLAHMSSDLTPYHYASNNPVSFNDPWGLMVNVDGYSDSQIRSLYRSDRASGYWGDFANWAQDNLDFGGGGSGRTVIGTDGREYGVNKNGEIGYGHWKDDDTQMPMEGEAGVIGKKSVFVVDQQSSASNYCSSCAISGNGFQFHFGIDFTAYSGGGINGMLKNGIGGTLRDNSKVVAQVSGDTHYRGVATTFQNSNRTVSELGWAIAGFGMSMALTDEISDSGVVLDKTGQFNIGFGLFGLQINLDGNNDLVDWRLGVDTSLGLSTGLGGTLGTQIGLMYVK